MKENETKIKPLSLSEMAKIKGGGDTSPVDRDKVKLPPRGRD